MSERILLLMLILFFVCAHIIIFCSNLYVRTQAIINYVFVHANTLLLNLVTFMYAHVLLLLLVTFMSARNLSLNHLSG